MGGDRRLIGLQPHAVEIRPLLPTEIDDEPPPVTLDERRMAARHARILEADVTAARPAQQHGAVAVDRLRAQLCGAPLVERLQPKILAHGLHRRHRCPSLPPVVTV